MAGLPWNRRTPIILAMTGFMVVGLLASGSGSRRQGRESDEISGDWYAGARPCYSVSEARVHLAVASRVEPRVENPLAAALLPAVSEAGEFAAVDEAVWEDAHQGAYVAVRFDRRPTLDRGEPSLPISHVTLRLGLVRLVVRSDTRCFEAKYLQPGCLARVQEHLSRLTPTHHVEPTQGETFARWLGLDPVTLPGRE